MCTKQEIAPEDFSIQGGLRISPLQDIDQELVAHSIIVFSQLNENKWQDFTWEEYQQLCDRDVDQSEKEVLGELVELGYLSLKNDTYSIEDYFISLLIKFVKFT